MLKHFLLLLVAAVSIQAATAYAQEEERPEVSRYVKAYTGPENIKIWTVRIGPESNGEVLFQVSGVDHPLDMKILKLKSRPASVQNGTREWCPPALGGRPPQPCRQIDVFAQGVGYTMADKMEQDYNVFIIKPNNEHGVLVLPETNKDYLVTYDKDLSVQRSSERFLDDYLKQSNYHLQQSTK